MNRSRLAMVLATIAVAAASPALARDLRGPAEQPPTSFEGMQYVDSRGCAFVKAGISGDVVWVPRVNRDRSQICNQPPTFGARPATSIAAATPSAPAARVEPPARRSAGAPIETVASRTMPAATPPRAASPQATPLTMAQVCDGRSGILPDYRTATGGPVDCGGMPAPTVTLAAATPTATTEPPTIVRVDTPPSRTLAEVCVGHTGPLPGYVNAATGQPVSCGGMPEPIAAAQVAPETATPAPAITLAQVCEGHSGLLQGYRTSDGAPVVCGAPSAPTPARVASATCPPGVVGGVAYRCGGAVDPLSSATLSLGGVARALEAPRIVTRAPVSNPVAAAPVTVTPPAGYAPVWDDGRINPQRGLPDTQAAVVNRAPAPSTIAATPAPAPAAAPGHRYVQVGTYGEAANAQRAVARLQALGLPATTRSVTQGGRSLTVVSAGPFGDASALQAALRAARNSGYSDAFTRG